MWPCSSTPHHLYWKPTPESELERVITELFNSDAFIGEYEELLKHPPPSSGPHIETAIAAMMVWSDSTHLAEFGMASLWPIYLFFGNQSKYSCAKPSDFAVHHVAHIPSVCPFYSSISATSFIFRSFLRTSKIRT
jgi:hypothetical protein